MQVFISYAKSDEQFASDLTEQLRKAGVPVWSASDSIFPGDNWPLEVGKALEKSDVLVAAFRRGSDNSAVARDVQYALTSGSYHARVIPVLLDYVTFQAGVEVPWILLHMDPIYLSGSGPDWMQVVKRVQEVADAGFHASA